MNEKTRKIMKSGQGTLFIENTKRGGWRNTGELIGQCHSAQQMVAWGFPWDSSPQGYDYWRDYALTL